MRIKEKGVKDDDKLTIGQANLNTLYRIEFNQPKSCNGHIVIKTHHQRIVSLNDTELVWTEYPHPFLVPLEKGAVVELVQE